MLVGYAAFALQDRDGFRLPFLENHLGQLQEFTRNPQIFAAYELVCERVAAATRMKVLRLLPPNTARLILWGAVRGIVALTIAVHEMDFGDTRSSVWPPTYLRGRSAEPEPA